LKTVRRRLDRLQGQFVLVGRRPLRVYRMVLCKYGGKGSLDNAICTRTLCADGTVAEYVELDGSNDGPGSVTAEELDRWVASFPIQANGAIARQRT